MDHKRLLDDDDRKASSYGTRAFMDFLVMSVAFSVNHGTVTAVLSLASSEFPDNLAAYSSAGLYLIYMLTSLFLAVPAVLYIGPKWSLVCGLGLYCFWPLAFAVTLLPAVKENDNYLWLCGMTGSVIGGFGAGWIWTAQGAYFARAASYYADEHGMKKEDASGYMGGIFATIYVGIELIMKLSASLVQKVIWKGDHGHTFLFIFYSACAVVATIAMVFVRDIPDPEEVKEEMAGRSLQHKPSAMESMCKKMKVMATVLTDPQVWLLAPLNFAYGFNGSYLSWYINGKVAPDSIGKDSLGYLVSIIPAYVMLFSTAYAYIGKIVGKGPMMILGALSFGSVGTICALFSRENLIDGSWTLLIVMYLLHGSGRTVFESTNKSVFADFFPNTKEGAFAMVAVQNGLAGFIGYFVFTDSIHLNPRIGGLIVAVLSGLAVCTLTLAFYRNKRKKNDEAAKAAFINETTSPNVNKQDF